MRTMIGCGLFLVAGIAGAQPPGGGGPPTFAGLDTNKNGSLTKEEVGAFFAGRGGPQGVPNVDDIFGRWDANKDGSVSQQEFDSRPRQGGPGGGPPGGAPPGSPGGAPPAGAPPAR
jgi:hypothetical protein